MKKAGSVLWGIVLIAAGVIWALNEFNVTNINVFFEIGRASCRERV